MHFTNKKRYLEANEPVLLQHLNDLIKAHPKGSQVIRDFKKLIGECHRGNFDTPSLRAVRKRILIKEWGKSAELGSWKQVLDRHGQNVACAALRQGTLPYVPHTLLLPGHGVKWPESHEFLMERKFWNQHWREEVRFESDDDNAVTKAEINQWLRDNGVQCDEHQEWSDVKDSALTGIPSGMDMPSLAPTPTVTVKTEEERAIHPDFCGPKYDELHSQVAKNIQRVIQEWPKHKSKHEIAVAKAEPHPLCTGVIGNLKALLQAVDKNYKSLEEANTAIAVKRRGFLSKDQLEKHKDTCEKVWTQNKDVGEMVKALDGLSKLPTYPTG